MIAVNARRVVIALSAVMVVCLVLIVVESALGIGFGWRLVLNQLPASLTVHRVLRWTEPPPQPT